MDFGGGGETMISKMKGIVGTRHRRLVRFNREILLQSVFYRSTADLGLSLPPIYPVGAAANYGLLYLVSRIVSENKLARVLDIGAGQTSLLLDALSKKYPIETVTLESDAGWAARIGSMVGHKVIHSPLAEIEVRGRRVLGYSDLSRLVGSFDLIIIDGPMGTDRFSRWAALDILDKFRGTEFIAIFDDAERRGERDTIEEFMRGRTDKNFEGTYFAAALKQQFVAFTSQYSHVCYYNWL